MLLKLLGYLFRFSMKKIWLLIALISSVAKSETIYLIRHAEKVDDGSKDPVLTLQGQQRAHNIADMLSHAGIQHIYSTDYRRTQLTAKPLSEFLGTPVISYDPSQLVDFAEQLKQQTGNVLVVGHSNTTPMLTFLLSKQSVFNLDEADFDNVFQVVLKDDKASLNMLKSSPSNATHKLKPIKPDSDHFFSGELLFNSLYKGQVVGQTKHVFKKRDEQYLLSEVTRVESMKIKTDTKVSVDVDTLKPIYLSINGSIDAPVDVKLDWSNDVLKGHSKVTREPFKRQGEIQLNERLRSQTLEQNSIRMLAHLIPVSEAHSLFINRLDGLDGGQRLIEISYQGEERITVPVGIFDTYKVKFSGGAPSQYLWIDKNQAKVVKVEEIKSPWSYELVDFTVQ